MNIINQDRDKIIECNKGDILWTKSVFYNGVFMGSRLYINKEMIGTFDSIIESCKEIEQIKNYRYSYYVISGFSEYYEL